MRNTCNLLQEYSITIKRGCTTIFIGRRRKFTVRNVKILPKLRGYNNYSHPIDSLPDGQK
jgi:hypothetical protein